MADKNKIKDLLSAAGSGMSAEEMMLASLQGVIAGEISMKRQELGLSQDDMAQKLGVSQGLVSRWERAETNFTLETLVRIASVLGLNVQSPIVPKAPQAYTVGSSNVIVFPVRSDGWRTESRSLPSNYDAKEN